MNQTPDFRKDAPVIYTDPQNRYQVVGQIGRLYLIKGDYTLGELVNGMRSLTKSYKGDFNVWYEFLKNRDLNQININNNKIQELLKANTDIVNLYKEDDNE